MFIVQTNRTTLISDSSETHGLYGLPGSSIHGMLEWVAIPFSRESSPPRDKIQVSHIAGRFFTD